MYLFDSKRLVRDLNVLVQRTHIHTPEQNIKIITSKFSFRLMLGNLGAVTCTETGVVLEVVINNWTSLPRR